MDQQVILRFLLDSGLFIQAIYPSLEAKRIVQDWSQRKSIRIYRPEHFEGIDLECVQAIHAIPPEVLQQVQKPINPVVPPGSQYPHNYFGPGASGVN